MIDKLKLQRQQQFEDSKFLQDVERTAQIDFNEYLQQDDIIFGEKNYGKLGIIVSVPVRCTYTIYDEATAKYKNANFQVMVKEIFKQFKSELCSLS